MHAVLVLTLAIFAVASLEVSAAAHTLKRKAQTLTLDIHPELEASEEAVLNWVEDTAESLASVFGRWPRDRWTVEVRSVGGVGQGPVPWGQVIRGNPDRVLFYIDPGASAANLLQDWTAYHEFSHLLIPYRGRGELWFSEGLATYYQNLLQYRAGRFDELGFWRKLHAGFLRGQDNRRPDMSLTRLSAKMRESRSFMRVYWSGVWYWLQADIELRQRSGDTMNLDSALESLNRCCAERSFSARRIAAELDRLTGENLFQSLFEELRESMALPSHDKLFAELGLAVEGDALRADSAADAPWRMIQKGPHSSK